MKIAMIGAGAMGSLFGASLALAGHEVCLVDVNEDHISAVNTDGLIVEHDSDGTVCARPRAGRAEDFSGVQDFVIVFTKGLHTESALLPALHLVGEKTWVLTAQNGMGNVEVIARHVPLDRIAIGTTSYAAMLRSPGRLSVRNGGNLRIWPANGNRSEAIQQLADAITSAGLDCKADKTVEAAIWEKIAFNAAINSTTAVTRYTVGEVGDFPAGRKLSEMVAKEVCDVASARGINISLPRVYQLLDMAFAQHRGHRPSMLCDILEGRPTEIESINGAVVAEAKRLGLQATATETLLLLMRLTERSSRQ